MQIPEPPLPPLAPIWDRVLRAQALPPDVDAHHLYVAIRDRLTHHEWEVRLNALRVLTDLLPLSGNALEFPIDEVIENLGHGSPNVRKAALDALKMFCTQCEDPAFAVRDVLDKCSYQNIRMQPNESELKTNVITGLILSIPSLISILKRRCIKLDLFPAFDVLGKKLLDHNHSDVAWRSLIKLKRICGPRDFMMYITQMDNIIKDKFRLLCELYDEDSLDVYYAPRKNPYGESDLQTNHYIDSRDVMYSSSTPIKISSSSSSEDSFKRLCYRNNFGKVIIETEIKFDSDTAITMTVLEENETESETVISDDDKGSCDRNVLRYNESTDNESEDADVIVKKVRFGGESVKIRTPDSENPSACEEDTKPDIPEKEDNTKEAAALEAPEILKKAIELKNESIETKSIETKSIETKSIETKSIETKSKTTFPKISGIPLPITSTTKAPNLSVNKNYRVKQKSKSLSELYDYFRTGNKQIDNNPVEPLLALDIPDTRSYETLRSPVEPHREIEVLHNLQRSPIVSPRRRMSKSFSDDEGIKLYNSMLSIPEQELIYPRLESPLRYHYDWEDYQILPKHFMEPLHNTDNWIATVKSTDQLHRVMLEKKIVNRVEPAASSLIQHMWALSKDVPAAKAPAEGVVCALFRNASNDCARDLLPMLVSRLGIDPPPAALPHALLQRVNLHTLVDLIFDATVVPVPNFEDSLLITKQTNAALCLARAAGSAAVMLAIRERLLDRSRAEKICQNLRELLNKPLKNTNPGHLSRVSHLPVPIRKRARSTPPIASTVPRRLRPLSDSAPSKGEPITKPKPVMKRQPSPDNKRDAIVTLSGGIQNNGVHEKNTFIVENGTVHKKEEPPETISKTPKESPSYTIHLQDYSDISELSFSIENLQQNEPDNTSITFEEPDSVPDHEPQTNVYNNIRPLSRNSEGTCQSPNKSGVQTPIQSQRNSEKSTPKRSRPGSSGTAVSYDIQYCERDVRAALSECLVPAKHDDWEVIVNGLSEIERLSNDASASAPAASWKAAVRSVATHVRSLRSRVARAACQALGSLFENRGKMLDPEIEEAAVALLERCADVNKFLRVDAADALVKIACAGSIARVVVALCRRGATHRAGPVRAAATRALTCLVQYHGASRILDIPHEPRQGLLRAVGDLLGDASSETRQQAKNLYTLLNEDIRFQSMLQECITITRYRSIKKYIDKLHL